MRLSCFSLVVVWNLVTIAAERYLAVCQPFKHSGFTKRKAVCIFILVYLMGIPCTSLAAFQVIISNKDSLLLVISGARDLGTGCVGTIMINRLSVDTVKPQCQGYVKVTAMSM